MAAADKFIVIFGRLLYRLSSPRTHFGLCASEAVALGRQPSVGSVRTRGATGPHGVPRRDSEVHKGVVYDGIVRIMSVATQAAISLGRL